jgi:hypothetical protein
VHLPGRWRRSPHRPIQHGVDAGLTEDANGGIEEELVQRRKVQLLGASRHVGGAGESHAINAVTLVVILAMMADVEESRLSSLIASARPCASAMCS